MKFIVCALLLIVCMVKLNAGTPTGGGGSLTPCPYGKQYVCTSSSGGILGLLGLFGCVTPSGNCGKNLQLLSFQYNN